MLFAAWDFPDDDLPLVLARVTLGSREVCWSMLTSNDSVSIFRSSDAS